MKVDTYIARQPIFDRQRKVVAYELLFRSSPENFFTPGTDGDQATSRVIYDSLFVFGLDTLTARKKTCINVTRRMVVDELYSVLPKENTILELIETVEPDADVVAACRELKRVGYQLALDDFVYRPDLDPLLEIADILKIDFQIVLGKDRKSMMDRFGSKKCRLLAEKVETYEEYNEARDLGYSLFQGYFFCKPEILSRKDIPRFKLNYIRFLQALNQPELDLDKLEEIIRQEVSLSIKLLRFLNSAVFGWRSRVTSIKQALVLLGERPLRKWATVVALAGMGEDKPPELVVVCLIRARFCELLGAEIGLADRSLDLFLMGMLSALDAVTDRPLESIMTEVAVPDDIRQALKGAPTPLGRIFSLAVAYERGDWNRMNELQQGMKISDERVPENYRLAVLWAEQVFHS